MEDKELYQPVEWWSEKIKLLDDRVKLIANTFGFGEVGMKLIMKHGKIIDVTYTEKITVRQTDKDAKSKEKKKDAA